MIARKTYLTILFFKYARNLAIGQKPVYRVRDERRPGYGYADQQSAPTHAVKTASRADGRGTLTIHG